jgi:hypothetical protein
MGIQITKPDKIRQDVDGISEYDYGHSQGQCFGQGQGLEN